MKDIIYIITILLFFVGCESKQEDESIFPDVQNITDLNKTDFVPTLESTFSIEKNNIYGATLPFAWNEIRNKIDTTLTGFSSPQLEELNNTKSYIDVLKKDEYETSVEIDGNEIKAKAYFRKSLPFEEPLEERDEPLEFLNSNVTSFGFWGYRSFAKVNYYNDENEFSVSLFPENEEHEIILIMYQDRKNDFFNFKGYFDRYNQQINLESNKSVEINENDQVEIPIIEFNLEKKFDKIIGSRFIAGGTVFDMLKTYQRNAFVFNEKGAEVESEVVMEAAEAAADAVDELKPKPKMMIFNKPFVVFLKRKDAEYPYFGVYLSNEELMKKR